MSRSKKATASGRPRERKRMPSKRPVADNICEYCGKKRRFNPSEKHGMKCQKCRAKGVKIKFADRPKPEPKPTNDWICPECGHTNPEELLHCDNCAQSLPDEETPEEV